MKVSNHELSVFTFVATCWNRADKLEFYFFCNFIRLTEIECPQGIPELGNCRCIYFFICPFSSEFKIKSNSFYLLNNSSNSIELSKSSRAFSIYEPG